jgi:hypothetical protein
MSCPSQADRNEWELKRGFAAINRPPSLAVLLAFLTRSLRAHRGAAGGQDGRQSGPVRFA